jgi:hypothetical protein
MTELDPLGLLGAHTPTEVFFGDVDASLALVRGNFSSALDRVDSAELTLDTALLSSDPIDYIASLRVVSGRGRRRNLFNGHATSAIARGDLIEITARGSSQLTEQVLGPFAARDVPHFELVHLMARASGMAQDQLVIPALESLPWEVFEVFCAVDGIALSRTRKVASITMLPRDQVVPRLDAMGFDEDLLRELREAPGFALASETSKLGFDAEQRGLDRIDSAIAWLTTRARHGLALRPDGKPQPYSRDRALTLPRRRDLVVVRGVVSGRRWIRSVEIETRSVSFSLDEPDQLLGAFDESASTTARLAVSACHRAAAEREPFARLQAIWEAIELLVAGTSAPKRFTGEELDAIKASLPAELSPELRKRATDAVTKLNDPPLLARLRELIDREALPCASSEMDLLARLRRVRNRVAHGKKATVPRREELARATAIVSRLVVHRLEQKATWPGSGK